MKITSFYFFFIPLSAPNRRKYKETHADPPWQGVGR